MIGFLEDHNGSSDNDKTKEIFKILDKLNEFSFQCGKEAFNKNQTQVPTNPGIYTIKEYARDSTAIAIDIARLTEDERSRMRSQLIECLSVASAEVVTMTNALIETERFIEADTKDLLKQLQTNNHENHRHTSSAP